MLRQEINLANEREVAFRALRCVLFIGCGRKIDLVEYKSWDIETYKRFSLTGLCVWCQLNNGEPIEIYPDYDVDLREDEPPADINKIEW